ncbi:hypothetical protein D8O27_26165 [Burkholderia mallei]|uniref:Uncharacterized protein n=3 Tax=pseudomallei group TaxID=111527 RepID=A0AAX1X2J2_BURML|nr:hypothetical protein BMA3084 [Burkholderia mallei ATCC 23344]AYE26963.1 hypothetical protein CNX72_05660 [Burkholderia pseudomallei]RKN94033.1 hypothetical protein D8O03_25970 [Burkholderia mallei]AYX05977.1 hypothetical protein EGY14_19135 [Burkholderia pseudomallei]MBM5577742.1 hypothetical protein [Burkholderia pseudomallei]
MKRRAVERRAMRPPASGAGKTGMTGDGGVRNDRSERAAANMTEGDERTRRRTRMMTCAAWRPHFVSIMH